jgi:hypothetical protein
MVIGIIHALKPGRPPLNNRLALLFFMIFLGTNGCREGNLCVDEEVGRKRLTGSIIEAVIVKRNCGATADNSFQVFIIPAGESDLGESIFLADQVENISISWESKKNLIISYDKARIFQFRNFWQSSEVDNFQTTISIVERSNKL